MKNFLIHHGVQKQKWGVRNGPPYPLDASQVPAEQRKANPKIYSDGRDDYKKKNQPDRVDFTKRRLTRREVRNLTNKELDMYIQRAFKEKTYYQTIREINDMTDPLRVILKRALLNAGQKAMEDVSKDTLTFIGQSVVKNIVSGKGSRYNIEDVGNAFFGSHYKSIEKEMDKRLHPEKYKNDKGKGKGKGNKGGKGNH